MLRKMAPRILLMVLAPFFLACSGDVQQPRLSDETDAVSGGETEVCLQRNTFVADGIIPIENGDSGAMPGGAEADAPLDGADSVAANNSRASRTASRISDLRWEMHDECGRFVIDFSAEDGTPAGAVGNVQAELLRDLGVVRITLPGIQQVDTGATDASFDGLVRGAYVVRSGEGPWLYVDLHLADGAEVFVDVLEEPVRVVVDLRPGGPALSPPAAVGPHVVVLEPRPGEHAYPITVTGYARTFEANVVARLEQDGNEVAEDFTTSTAWIDAWGHYSMTFEEGPSGPIKLHVGEHSARDGAWEGVVVDLDMQ